MHFIKCTCINTIIFAPGSQCHKFESNAFSESSIVKIKIPSSVTSIDKSAFENCYGLHHVDFEENSKLAKIHNKAFSFSGIRNISIPKVFKK